jgi:hypothetical protein
MVLHETDLLQTVELARFQGAVELSAIVPHAIEAIDAHDERVRQTIIDNGGSMAVDASVA